MEPEMIDISSLDFEQKPSGNLRSTNFGHGIELLMNDRVKEGSMKLSSDIDIEDLNNLESELNDLADETDNLMSSGGGGSSSYMRSDLFSNGRENDMGGHHSVRFEDHGSIGQATASTDASDSKTWDGYGKFNNIPVDPDTRSIPSQPHMSKEEMLREKFKYLRKLEALEKKGVELSKKYTMESPLLEMQGEYDTIIEEKTKHNSVKFQGNMLMAVINGIEFLNNRFDPFDVKLDGWGEQINENLTDYDEVFGELYDKYKSRASMAPELKLLFQLGGSAMMVHMSNSLFKSALPGMDDIMRQNPDLMRSFQNAAVNSMGQSNPGFANFMGGIMNPDAMNGSGGGPPPPMATQGPNAPPSTRDRPGNNSYSSRSNNYDDGISFKESNSRSTRPEMKGPSDIGDILSGLKTKTKTINIQDSSSTQPNKNDSSTISISDLKDLQEDGNMPKKSKRRQRSDKNTLSLDI